MHSFLIGGIPCAWRDDETALKRGTDCTSTDGLVALVFQCGPRYEPLSGAPFTSRGRHQCGATKGKPELARCRSDLFSASSKSRLAREQSITTIHREISGPSFHTKPVTMTGAGTPPGFTLTWRASKACPLVITAHRMRALLLARATAAFCQTRLLAQLEHPLGDRVIAFVRRHHR